MIDKIKNIFKREKTETHKKYEGFSDFFTHASPEEQINVLTEAARRANEDQLKVFNEAKMKVGAN